MGWGGGMFVVMLNGLLIFFGKYCIIIIYKVESYGYMVKIF